ncbi:peptidase S10, serine carboxypeptidase [Exidia glandulosa HHB12029]|uniref:Carboxypeptidase n=1 Tax=Exidia glandulosa HHB12029 TaxID=1314781 RepID=A0A165ZVD9_EXIGL|nr:peptidase S10, serine carboxypeptidase [Exidia glandulosa HHB12029]
MRTAASLVLGLLALLVSTTSGSPLSDERFAATLLPEHSLRFTEPQLCDPSVKQLSGYLDISDTKHLFFWFFESRNDPENAPLVLWLNGGPGCSSSTGLLMELGPCKVNEFGNDTIPHPHSWNTNANIIFLDSPANVGYSYSDSVLDAPTTTPATAVDVWTFLTLFISRFPKYASLPFHVAAESYGGHYAPHIAHTILEKRAEYPTLPEINLKSIVLANGLTEPLSQFEELPEWACESEWALWDTDSKECKDFRAMVPAMRQLTKACYASNSRVACVPAGFYAFGRMYGVIRQTGLNHYDVRRECEDTESGTCYPELRLIDAYLDRTDVKLALGALPDREFKGCNMEVNQKFHFQGDVMKNSARLVPDLLNAGIRVLAYVGNTDAVCNWMGVEKWMEKLESKFQVEFALTRRVPWFTKDSKLAGSVRAAGAGAGEYAFVKVHDAGHMAPYDQPEATLDLIQRWLADESLV